MHNGRCGMDRRPQAKQLNDPKLGPPEEKNMQLGFVSAIFRDLSLEEVLAFAGSEGYQCIEVMCWPSAEEDRPYGGTCHIDCKGFTQAHADDVRALCEKYKVQISALG